MASSQFQNERMNALVLGTIRTRFWASKRRETWKVPPSRTESAVKRGQGPCGGQGQGKSVVQESVVGNSGNNGVVEKDIGGSGGTNPGDSAGVRGEVGYVWLRRVPIVTYFLDCSMCSIAWRLGKNEQSAYERSERKVASVLGLELGE